jgi:hypothetical protein
MANDPEVQLKPGGAQVTKPPTPQAIAAQGKARDSLARTIIGGVVLGFLCVAFIVALCKDLPETGGILGVIGTGLGFLLGKSRAAK